MGARYSADGQSAGATPQTLLNLIGATTVRLRLYDLVCGSDATPADNAFELNLNRTTAVGTGTAVTPTALDSADPTAEGTADENHSVEPTSTAGAVLLNWMQNQRATFRWVAAPFGELIVPATAANGIAAIVIGATAAINLGVTFHWEE
jgi:hypothetical protein